MNGFKRDSGVVNSLVNRLRDVSLWGKYLAALVGVIMLSCEDDTIDSDPEPPPVERESVEISGSVRGFPFNTNPDTYIVATLVKNPNSELGRTQTEKDGSYSLELERDSDASFRSIRLSFLSEGNVDRDTSVIWKDHPGLDFLLERNPNEIKLGYELFLNNDHGEAVPDGRVKVLKDSFDRDAFLKSGELKSDGFKVLFNGTTSDAGEFKEELNQTYWVNPENEEDTIFKINTLKTNISALGHESSAKTNNVNVKDVKLEETLKKYDGKTVFLTNTCTNKPSPGYIILGSDSIFTPTGIIEGLHIPDDVTTIKSGLVNPTKHDEVWSYIRTTSNNNKILDKLEIPHVDFYLRDLDKNIIDSLYTDLGGDPDNMSVQRYYDFLSHAHFYARRNRLPIEYFDISEYENYNALWW